MSSLRPHLDVFARLRAQLLSFSDVSHADLGWRYHAGERTDEPALRLFVPRKRRDGGGLAPSSLEGMRIDVREVPLQRECDSIPEGVRLSRKALEGGISIGAKQSGAGTLGMLVRRGKQTCVLTADHVAEAGAEIHQPAPIDALGHRRIGEVVERSEEWKALLIRLDAPDSELQKKRGIAKLLAPKAVERRPVGSLMKLPKLRGVVGLEDCFRLWLDHKVLVKSGRTTGVTRAVLDGIDSDGVLSLVSTRKGEEISCGGDSGAIWCTEDGLAVGIHYAGNVHGAPPLALAAPVWRVMEGWGLEL